MKFINIAKFKFILEPRYYFYGWSKSPKILARESAAKALLKARSFLPKGYNFKIWDGQRTKKIQIKMAGSFRRRLRAMHPEFSGKERQKLLSEFASNPFVRITALGSHRQGGAFDLTIVDRNGNELYMGTDHDDLTPKAAVDYYENKKNLTALEKTAKKNRRLLKKAMKEAGFKEYSPEWWHWGIDF